MRLPASLLLSFTLLAPAAMAQSPDSKYCSALAEKYDAYIDTQGDKGGAATPIAIVTAVGKCTSDPVAAIPVLEKALKAARLDPPPR
ncbi:MAG TPA: hypothetical protein VMI56_04960 [Reyranella sp.]|nr:hypothetical protein [Reyranella sp.]